MKINFSIIIAALSLYACSNLPEQNTDVITFTPSNNTLRWAKATDTVSASNFAFCFLSQDTFSVYDTLKVKAFMVKNKLKLADGKKMTMSCLISKRRWFLVDEAEWKSLKVVQDTGYLALPLLPDVYADDSIEGSTFTCKITLPLSTGKDSTFLLEAPVVFNR